MERRDYEDLKKLAEEAFRRAEDEHRQNLAAIERLWVMSQSNGTASIPDTTPSLPAKQVGPRPKHKPATKKGWIIQDVRQVIKNLDGNFTFRNVLERLGLEKPHLAVKRGTLNAILKKLNEIGELELVSQGIGRKPSQYRRK